MEKNILTIYAKVSINQNLFSRPINELVNAMVEALIQPKEKYMQKIKGKEYIWALASGKEYNFPEGKVIFGRIIKTSPEVIPLWDFESEQEIDNLTPNYLNGLCHYLFDPKEELIVFRCNPNIPVKQMMEAFSKLCEINSDELGSIKVIPFLRDKDLVTAIKDMHILTRVKFSIIPANPGISPEFEAIEKALGKTGTKKTILEFNGSDLTYDNTILEEATNKVIAGQGEATYIGRDRKNQEKVISSRNYSIKTKKKVAFSEQGILSGLYSVLLSRTNK